MGLRWDPSSDLLKPTKIGRLGWYAKLGVKISKGTVSARWIDQIVEIPPMTSLCGNVILMLTVHVLGRGYAIFGNYKQHQSGYNLRDEVWSSER